MLWVACTTACLHPSRSEESVDGGAGVLVEEAHASDGTTADGKGEGGADDSDDSDDSDDGSEVVTGKTGKDGSPDPDGDDPADDPPDDPPDDPQGQGGGDADGGELQPDGQTDAGTAADTADAGADEGSDLDSMPDLPMGDSPSAVEQPGPMADEMTGMAGQPVTDDPMTPAGMTGGEPPAMDAPSTPTSPLSVQFDPPPGGFPGNVDLQLSTFAPDAQVHYTLDGTIPSLESPVASGPIQLSATTLVRAFVARDGRRGSISNAVYFRLADYAQGFRSDLPVVVVDMQSSGAPMPSNREYVDAVAGVFAPSGGVTRLDRAADVTRRIGIRVRGRSSRYADKPSYTMELRGLRDDDDPAPLLGLPADGDWVMYAPYETDPTLMHNALGYELSRRVGRYAPRTRFCELFLTPSGGEVSKASYAGIYVLTERISRGAERVAVDKLGSDDLVEPQVSGGYIVQVNPPDPNDKSFSAAGMRFLYVYPKDDKIVTEQMQYIEQYIDAAMRAVSATDGRDPSTGVHYEELIDVPSFIDHHILGILFKNPDAFSLSAYYHKSRGGLLAAGPLWDLDLAMGANDPWGLRSLDPAGWDASNAEEGKFYLSFWGPLFQHADFEQAYWARFQELLAGPLHRDQVWAVIDGFAREVMAAELRNRERWPKSAPRDNDYAAEIAALRSWFEQRLRWVGENIGSPP